MSVVKVLRRFACLVVLCVLSILATCARVQAVTRYFDVNGTTAGSGVVTGTTYDWDGLFWNNNDAAGTTAPTSWDPQSATGDFAKFAAGTDANGKTYTVNLNANHTSNGVQSATNSGGTVKITTAAGVELKVAAGAQGYFAGTNSTLEFDGTIGAFDNTSQFVWQGGGGSLNLYGTFNSSEFSQPIQLNSGNGVNFNSANSFGTLGITYSGTLTTAVLANPTVGNFTIANAVTMPTGKNSSMIYTGIAPVTFTNWTLGGGPGFTSTLQVANNSFRTAKMIINNLAGSGNLTIGSPNGDLLPDNGTLQLTGTSAYGGITRIGLITGSTTTPAVGPTGNSALQADEGSTLSAGILVLQGGVLQTSGTFNRPLGASNAGEVAWDWPSNSTTSDTQTTPGGGGFSAIGTGLTVNINGDSSQLLWGDDTVRANALAQVGVRIIGPLKFGSATATAKTTWVNPVNMNDTGVALTRTITVAAGAGGDSAEMTGILSNSSGDAGVKKTGTGMLILNQANTYTGATTISNTAFGATGTISGGILSTSLLANGGTASGIGQSSNAAANLVFSGGTAGTTSGSTAGATLQYTGAGVSTDRLFTLGAGTSAGTIDSSGTGALTLSNAGAIAFTGLGVRTLTLSGTNTGNNTMTPVIGDDTTAGSGATSLTKSGAGTWILPSANTYTGTTAVNGGNLIMTNANAVPSANALTLGGGTLTNSTGSLKTIAGATTLSANSTLAGADSFTFSGTFTNSGGSRTLTVNTANATLSGPVSLSNNGTSRTLTIAGTGNTTITGVIANGSTSTTSALTKSGASTLTLTNANTYGGTTTINTGSTLLANNSSGSATGTGAVTVSAGGTLGGTGTVGGAVTNNGIIAPGAAGVGTLSVGGGVTDGASSSWSIELSGASADMLTVTGNIDLSAVDSLNVTGAGTGSSWLIGTYTGTLTGVFDTITSGYSVSYTGGNITLSTAVSLPGDFNGDGKVDASDYVFVRKQTPDITSGTGLTNYNTWRANFGNPPGAGSGGGLGGNGAAVPEPSSFVLLMFSLVALAGRRRER
jgi:fibronectin-binding autotransporter adhesin